jgi:hypothetical protein
VVRCGLAGTIWGAGVSSGCSIVVMETTDITMSHTLGRGKQELSPSLKAESSSLSDSLRMACSDRDPLWAMPPATVSKSAPSVDRLELLGQLVMSSRSLKWMALS